ncbi:MAG: M20 metallopeptidase family protein [Balneolaceae bacterium]
MSTLSKKIQTLVQGEYDYMVHTRRHLHKNPEVSFKEHDTTEFIVRELKSLGLPVERPLETGCVAILEGGQQSDRVIALRADIDALAMDEAGEAKQAFLSERPGAAHCCGHDAHTTNLLAAARILVGMQEEVPGTVLLIFQPGEEKLPGGGRLLCETGFLQERGVQQIFGLHTIPQYKPGEIGVKPGPLMARPDEFEITLHGTGGHAASPHTAVDPIVMAASVIQQFQTIVSRSVDPTENAVVTIGRVRAGTTYNVIPETAELIGTVRTFSVDTAHLIRSRMDTILKGVTQAAGGSYDFAFNEGYPAVVNDEEATDTVLRVATTLLGEQKIHQLERPLMAGEDFAFYQQHFPGAFFFLGSGSEAADSQWSWHHPRYNVDEESMRTGTALLVGLALDVG